MKTTSQIILYANDINFDDASAEWLLNKKKLNNETYVYICEKHCNNGNKCNRKVFKQSLYCKIHQ